MRKFNEIFATRANQESLLTDLIKGVGTVKLLNAEVAARWKYEEALTDTLKARNSFSLLASGLASVTDGYAQIVKYGLMGFAAYWGIRGSLSPGQVVAISMLAGQIIGPFQNLAHNWPDIQEIKTVFSRLDDIFLTASEQTNERGVVKAKFTGEIEFQNVWFRYGGDSSEWVLRGASFKIKAGQHVSIVGPSGCGKSTVAHLLARMFEPTQGQILIDGRDYREYDIHWLRSQIGLLQQEPVLFAGNVAENIAFGKPKFSFQEVEAAAKLADANDFITKKNLAYFYSIDYGGIGLSGGQKQRLALARTLCANPSLIILDEATSMLDGISEANLLRNIYSKYKDKTILSIAHRYTTARASDFVLIMENGRVAGFGTHENLEAEEGIYTQLFGIKAKRVA
jgi:ABC-type bacteriocin/lantibiotic exporter with double-glycine peptidase domain